MVLAPFSAAPLRSSIQAARPELLMKPTPLVGFAHPYLRPAERKRTGFAAPAWHAFGWVNVARGQQPPTLANTKGKVVVIHCFQSW